MRKFYMEPEPYWEQAEDSFTIHYTKTVVTGCSPMPLLFPAGGVLQP
jgi:hypothetical protein